MDRVVQKFRSFEDADEADDQFYAELTPEARLDMLLELVERHRSALGEAANRLREFIGLLNSHHVEYLVVGGHAVAFHGHPRFTGAIDFFIRATPVKVHRILAVLDDFGFGGLGITENDLLADGRVVQLGQPPNRIDILTSISGVDFDTGWDTRVETMLDDQPVTLLGWDALLQNKQAAGRQKDLSDLAKLRAVAKRKPQRRQ